MCPRRSPTGSSSAEPARRERSNRTQRSSQPLAASRRQDGSLLPPCAARIGTETLEKKTLHARSGRAFGDVEVVLGIDRDVVRKSEAAAEVSGMTNGPDNLHVPSAQDPHRFVLAVRHIGEALLLVPRECEIE